MAASVVVRGRAAADQLDERHDRHRAEEVHPDEPRPPRLAHGGRERGRSRSTRCSRRRSPARARARRARPRARVFTATSSKTASTTRSRLGDGGEVVGGGDPLEDRVAPLLVELALGDGALEVAGDPRRARPRPGRGPARRASPACRPRRWTWAMPWPISPAPATNTRCDPAAHRASSSRLRRARVASSRSAAVYGSSSWVATAASRASVVRPVPRRPEAFAAAARRRSPRPGLRPGEPGRAAGRRGPPPRCRSSAASSSGTPVAGRRRSSRAPRAAWAAAGPSLASRRRGRPTSIARSWLAVRWAPGRSPLLTTTMSATSSRPALIAWTSSPISGASSDDRRVGDGGHLDLALAGADGLDAGSGRSPRRRGRPPPRPWSRRARRRGRATAIERMNTSRSPA